MSTFPKFIYRFNAMPIKSQLYTYEINFKSRDQDLKWKEQVNYIQIVTKYFTFKSFKCDAKKLEFKLCCDYHWGSPLPLYVYLILHIALNHHPFSVTEWNTFLPWTFSCSCSMGSILCSPPSYGLLHFPHWPIHNKCQWIHQREDYLPLVQESSLKNRSKCYEC